MLYIRGTAETDSTNNTRSMNKYILTTREKKKNAYEKQYLYKEPSIIIM